MTVRAWLFGMSEAGKVASAQRQAVARTLARAAILLVRMAAVAALALPPLAAVVYLTRWITM